MDVALLRWPHEADRRADLAARHMPRLLLVEDGQVPPIPSDCHEDWVVVPVSEAEVQARIAALRVRGAAHNADVPTIDADGVVRFAGSWVPLPPLEARLARCLVDRFGWVVSRDALTRAGWPGDVPARNVLDVHVLRLRRRLSPLGLAIRTVRSRGYLLESGAVQERVREA